MKRLLIVSPHFPPVNAPDMQRVRLALPHLRACGWEPIVLAVSPESIEGGVIDPLLRDTFPSDIRIVSVRGIPASFTRWLGLGNLWWRCGRALTRAGDRLLATEKFDAVFFSTTQFSAFRLGPRWKAKFGIPYVLDYQDPWLNTYYARTRTPPPGGRLKFALSQCEARRAEPQVLREASGVVAVSQAYGRDLASNYPWFDARRVKVLPFGASATDFAVLAHYRPYPPLIDFQDGCRHFAYVGRCGADMKPALTALFRSYRLFRQDQPDVAGSMRFHFIGTDYAPAGLGRDWVLPVARDEGVVDVVAEHRQRVSYFDALYYLKNADALMAIGSDDPSYSPSKIFPYVLAGRPFLLLCHQQSPVNEFARQLNIDMRFCFSDPEMLDQLAQDICRRWFIEGGYRNTVSVNEKVFYPYSAEGLTKELAAVFDTAASQT